MGTPAVDSRQRKAVIVTCCVALLACSPSLYFQGAKGECYPLKGLSRQQREKVSDEVGAKCAAGSYARA